MDSLPVEIIGVILSCIAAARNAKDHLQKLSFDISDFCSGSGNLQSSSCERIITEVLMRTTCLRELSIFFRGNGPPVFEFEAASVTAWLQHTRKTLESLAFRNRIKPSLNILDALFGGESVLKYLEWGCAYIPSVDPTIHRFESLVSLTVYRMGDCIAASNLEALLTVSPRGQHSLCCLKLENASIEELDLGKPDSIQQVHLRICQDFEAEWAKYHHVISSSSNLKKLHLSGMLPHDGNSFDIGLDKIGSSFPHLNFLALNYQHASKAFKRGGSAKGLILESITTLELSSNTFNKQFVVWIAGFLELCPNLKQLTIAGKARFGPSTERMLGYFSRMAQIMHPYPNINMKYAFLESRKAVVGPLSYLGCLRFMALWCTSECSGPFKGFLY